MNQDTDMFLRFLSRALWGARQFEMDLSRLFWDLQHHAAGSIVCKQVSMAVSKGKTCSQVLYRMVKPIGILAPVRTTSWLWQFLPQKHVSTPGTLCQRASSDSGEGSFFGIFSNKDIYLAYIQFGFWGLFPIRNLSNNFPQLTSVNCAPPLNHKALVQQGTGQMQSSDYLILWIEDQMNYLTIVSFLCHIELDSLIEKII